MQREARNQALKLLGSRGRLVRLGGHLRVRAASGRRVGESTSGCADTDVGARRGYRGSRHVVMCPARQDQSQLHLLIGRKLRLGS
jgi:hypothetical protein